MEALARALRVHGAFPKLLPGHDRAHGEIVVVDSYLWRADDGSRFAASMIVAIDDLDRDLEVDLLVDPSPGASAASHPSARRVLAGAKFALIGPEPTASPKTVEGEVATVLVTAGASDLRGDSNRFAEAVLEAVPLGTKVRQVVGPWSHVDVAPGVEVVQTTDGLDELLATADVVVTAGGVTMLEALRLGRPTIAVVLYDNQRRAAEGAARAGAVVLAGMDDLRDQLAELADDVGRRRALSTRAAALVDSEGAVRVTEAILD
jgi:spore coat polysaccharide biosynthesis predicted glycosyltransferase SpsG